MTILLLSLGAAVVLFAALAIFLQSSNASDSQGALQADPAVRELPEPYRPNTAAITDAIFSQRDWEFVQREGSASLERLFLAERRAVATYWLTVTSSRIATIRKNHLLNSRFAHNLSPGQELRLLLQFLYLSLICNVGLVVVQIAGPVAPANLAAHIQRIADSLPVTREGALLRVPEN